MMAASAADIPPELFDTILAYVGTNDQGGQLPFSELHDAKRIFSSCSLVCKYWCKLCRRGVFESIELRSREDVASLFSLVKAAPPCIGLDPVSSHIQILSIHYDISQDRTPWLHHIGLYCTSLLKGVSFFNLVIRGRPYLGATKDKSLSFHTDSALPRSLPSRLLPYTHITLRQVRFPTFTALKSVLQQMQKLLYIRWMDVNWDVDDSATSRSCWQLSTPIQARRKESTLSVEISLPPRFSYPSLAFVTTMGGVSACLETWIDSPENDLWASPIEIVWDTDAGTIHSLTFRIKNVVEYVLTPGLPPNQPIVGSAPCSLKMTVCCRGHASHVKTWAPLLQQSLKLAALQSITFQYSPNELQNLVEFNTHHQDLLLESSPNVDICYLVHEQYDSDIKNHQRITLADFDSNGVLHTDMLARFESPPAR